MAEKIKFRITDPETGESQVFERDESEIPAKQKLAKERGLEFSFVLPEMDVTEEVKSPTSEARKEITEAISPKGAVIGGLLSGLTLGGKEELTGLVAGEEAQRIAELETAAQKKERPWTYGLSKLVGGLAPYGAAGLAGAKLGAPAGPWGAAIGGMLGAAGAGIAESALSRTKEEREREGYITGEDVAMGALSGATEGVGRAAVPFLRGISKKIFDTISVKPPSKLSTLEKEYAKAVQDLQERQANLVYAQTKLRQNVAEAKGLKAINAINQEIRNIGKENIAKMAKLKDLEQKLITSPEYSALAAIGPAALGALPGEGEMTEEEISEYERRVFEEAMRKMQEKQSTSATSAPSGSQRRMGY